MTKVDVPSGPQGEPRWPSGLTGSISHTRDRAVAILAMRCDYEFCGVDCEDLMSIAVTQEIRDQVIDAREHLLLSRAFADPSIAMTLAFSVKESVFKSRISELTRKFSDTRIMGVCANAQYIQLSVPRLASNRFSGVHCIDARYLRMNDSTYLTLVVA